MLWVEETPSGGDPHLYKNILIPTDGSDLAAKAVEQGVLFAKEIGAKITAMTVTEPFHLLSVAASQLEYTPIEYKKHAEALCCTDQQPGAVRPRSDIYVRRTYSGRPSSSMRFSEATAMATSVVCRPLVRERSASPITRL